MAKRYAEHRRDHAMLAYFVTGSYRAASAETDIPPSDIHRWVTQNPERYEQLVREHGPKLREQVIRSLEFTAAKANTVTDEALDAASDAIHHGNLEPPNRSDYEQGDDGAADFEAAFRAWVTLKSNAAKDAQAFSNTAKNGATVLGITTEKSQLRQGLPTSIHSDGRDLEDIARALTRLAPGVFSIEGSADEITPTAHKALLAQSGTTNARSQAAR